MKENGEKNRIKTEKEIRDLINKKLAYIIVKLEHSPASYINEKNNIKNETITRCKHINNAV